MPGQLRYAEAALQLAAALAAREAGELPAARPAASVLEQTEAEDLDDDVAAIVRLARWWPEATSVVARDRERRAGGPVGDSGTAEAAAS